MGNLRISGGTRRALWRSRKTGFLAAICVVAALAGVGLEVSSPGFRAFRGVAELVEYHPSARFAERVAAIPVDVGRWVRAGDVVAQLDTRDTTAQLQILTAQLGQAQAQLEAQRIQIGRRNLFEHRRFMNAVEGANVALVQARLQREIDAAQRDGVEARVAWWDPMVEAKAAPGQTLEDLKEQRKVLDRKIPLDSETVKTWSGVLGEVQKRLTTFESIAPQGDEAKAIEAGLAPYKSAVEVLEARVAELEQRLESLTLRAPGDGVVYKIDVRPGDIATPGAPVVQIRAPATRHVLAYVSDVVASMVAEGAPATVIPRDASGREIKGQVLSLGSGLRPLPDQTLLNPNWREFGEEVVIELDQSGALAPGQVVDVRFGLGRGQKPSLVSQAEAASAPKVKEDAQPVAEVPQALRARTRVEPSGLLWVPELDRFLVVSDDTGRPGEDEQEPWLLTMDRQGRFDDRPLAVEGIDAWNDLESITRSPDGTIWVLSSQSVSRRGHRPEPRTLLVAIKVQDKRLRVTGKVSLSAALAAAGDPAWLAGLGLTGRAPGFEKGVADFDRELNIEGMTSDQDGLLFGLKRPLGADGHATVWRLAHPERLVTTGKLDRADLTVYGRLALNAGPSQREVSAGICDLLKLPDGKMVVMAVALPPKDGSPLSFPGDWSAMYVAEPPKEAGGALIAKKVHDFPGLKAEGVALTPEPGDAMIVFDRDAELPRWSRVPLPR